MAVGLNLEVEHTVDMDRDVVSGDCTLVGNSDRLLLE